MKTKSLATVEKTVSPIVEEARTLRIVDATSLTQAVHTLSQLNKFNDSIVEDREKITKPLNAALKEVRDKYRPLETALKDSIELIREKMGRYQTNLLVEKKKAEEELAARLSSGTIDMDTAVQSLSDIPADSIQTDVGKVKFKTVLKVRLLDPLLVPKEYWDLNEARVLAALKAGTVVPGAELEEVQVPINYR